MFLRNDKVDTVSKIDEMEIICQKQLEYLAGQLNKGSFQGRSFYGELFAALAMAEFDYNKYKPIIIEILDWYTQMPKIASNFHWEFNNYAMLKLGDTHEELKKYLETPLTYRGTKCSNWSLLRIVGKIMEGKDLARENPQEIVERMQLPNGLILDETHVASFQYHCFMMALIYDIYLLTQNKYYLDAFFRGVEFISNFTFENGDTLYVGRGQEQIFGYGTLIYIYSVSYSLTKNLKYYVLLEKTMHFVQSYWSEERMLPLVLNNYEVDSNLTLELTDRRHMGWYSYNNYYDYLPFFTYYLVESFNVLKNAECYVAKNNKYQFASSNYCDDYFMHYADLSWEIAMACYKGASANAQVFPFIMYKGREVTSVCGGDDYADVGYYQFDSIPLPVGIYSNTFLHMFDSRKNLKNEIRSVIRKNKAYSNIYLWEHGVHKLYLEEEDGKFGFRSSSKDYDFNRSIRCDRDKLFFRDSIKFNRNVSYKEFIPLKLVFPAIKETESKGCFQIPGGRLVFNTRIKALLHHKIFLTAKTDVDSIQVCLYDYTAKRGDEIIFEYILEVD